MIGPIIGIDIGSQGAIALLTQAWPGQAATFPRVEDDRRAEAALIAIAGLKRNGGAI